jgi:hypothetical protein
VLSAYCWPHSGTPGGAIPLSASSTLGPVHITVTRVGAIRAVVARIENVSVDDHRVPDDAVAAGCGWPVALEIATDPSWPSGFYEVMLEPADGWPRGRVPRDGSNLAFFVLHPAPGARDRNRALLVLGTNTWLAYNDFAGSNLYTGSTHVSWDRPMAPGLLAKPPGAGRRVAVLNPPDERMAAHVGYLALEHLSQWAGSAGWPNYEAPFLAWSERAGYAIDVATNADLERHPELLDGVKLMLCVGHDEYWSSPQRDAVEAHVARGGNLVVLSGNTCFWQVRYEDDGRTMIGYKQHYADDPVFGTDRQHLLTSIWSDLAIGRPENELTGVSFCRGGYARIGRRVPRGSGGYTVHRPDHWVFAGTDLEYGDLLGARSTVVGYECDGCAFTLVDGRPVPTHEDGCPEGFEILATSPAAPFDRRTALRPVPENALSEIEFHALRALGDSSPEACERLEHGNAVMGTWTHGSGGTVVTVGCTDWACGLGVGDDHVELVTRNLLDRLG